MCTQKNIFKIFDFLVSQIGSHRHVVVYNLKYELLKNIYMENLNSKLINLIEFALTNEEMISVRGGDSDPIPKPVNPPVII
jgi:hypothetical protein